jgi:hypothetical protein
MAHESYSARVEVAADARERALRALAWGVATDVFIAVLLALQVVILADVEWTARYWQVLGLLVAKTVVQSLVTSLGRRFIPPTS